MIVNSSTRLLIAVLCAALVARAGFLLFSPQPFAADPDGYWRLAENLARHGTLGSGDSPSAFRPPVYPLLLTPCAALGNCLSPAAGKIAVGILHLALGMAAAGLVYTLGLRLGLGNPWAALAAMLTVFDPILLHQSSLIMSETAAAFFTAAALFAVAALLQRPTPARAAIFGLTLGAAALCRPVFLPWLVLSIPLLWIVIPGDAISSRKRIILAAAVAAIILPAAWTIRNQIQFGRPILTTTHGGYTLYLANNPRFYDYLAHGRPDAVWDAAELGPQWLRDPQTFTPLAELAADREAYAAALAAMRNQPGMFCYSCLARIGRLWAVSPHQGSTASRWAVGVWYCLEYLAAALGVYVIYRKYKIGRSSWCVKDAPYVYALLLVVCVTAVHAFYWTDMRMRAPLVPILALAAAAGLSFLADKLIPKRRRE